MNANPSKWRKLSVSYKILLVSLEISLSAKILRENMPLFCFYCPYLRPSMKIAIQETFHFQLILDPIVLNENRTSLILYNFFFWI